MTSGDQTPSIWGWLAARAVLKIHRPRGRRSEPPHSKREGFSSQQAAHASASRGVPRGAVSEGEGERLTGKTTGRGRPGHEATAHDMRRRGATRNTELARLERGVRLQLEG